VSLRPPVTPQGVKALGDLVCIIDDDTSFRAAITRLLKLRGYDVADYGSADQFLRALWDGLEPACILLDMRMPGLSGPGLQAQLSQLGLSFPIIFVTGYGDVPTTVKAIKEGAEDVLTKPVSEQALTEGIRQALANFAAERAKREWLKGARSQLETLTPREREVFDYVVRGKMNKQTAHELGITERTIKAHRHRIFEKFGAKTVADLVSLAERLGVLTELKTPVQK
jgi:FixJ family two-component response regulator